MLGKPSSLEPHSQPPLFFLGGTGDGNPQGYSAIELYPKSCILLCKRELIAVVSQGNYQMCLKNR